MTLLRILVLLPLIALPAFAQAGPQQQPPEQSTPQPQLAAAAPAGAMVVYVSDFDLDVVHRKPSPKPATRTSSRSSPRGALRSPSGVPRRPSSASVSGPATSPGPDSSDASPEETPAPADRANALVNAVSENLIRALKRAGYDARRLLADEPLPKLGLRIRGVFAEADERNRARRLLVGGEPVSPNLILFVGVNNLTRPEQPLYALADPPANDPRHGPVITVTSYAPAERFEVSRDPSGDELEKISKQIAADFTALVTANRLSLAQ
jgi:uncharacterized protein DUF4410